MLKRLSPVALALASIVAPAALAANDDACTREMLKPVDVQAVKQHIDVSPLFAENDNGGEVLVARITPDGKAVLACVDSAEAAKKFLETPIEKVGRAKAEK